MRYLKNLKWEMILFSVMSIVMGILMFLYPSKIITAMCIIFAVILFIMGIKYLIEYKRKDSLGNFYRYDFVLGVLYIIAGIVVLACMDTILSIITYIIAGLIVISGLMKIENAMDLKKMGCKWVTMLVFAGICILLGIAVFMMPMNHNDDGTLTAGDFMIQAAGIIFAVTGLIDLITTLTVSGKIKQWIVDRNAIIAESEIDEE